jgi:hypothetical protein
MGGWDPHLKALGQIPALAPSRAGLYRAPWSSSRAAASN